MSSPAPVPSKAVIHALRGIVLGTSCSIVLLAEERRRRIDIARSAVENGRKLKSSRCYSTAGHAALEALQDEVSADSEILRWSSLSQTQSPAHILGEFGRDRSDLDRHDPDDLGPDPRQPQYTSRKQRRTMPPTPVPAPSQTEPFTHPTNNAERGMGRGEPSTHAQSTTQSPWSATGRQPTKHGVAFSGRQAIPLYRDARGPSMRTKQTVASVLDDFWSSASADPELSDTLQQIGIDRESTQFSRISPATALDILQRAHQALEPGQSPPHWLLRLSRGLCVVCQLQRSSEIAGRILKLLIDHGVIERHIYMEHCPFDIVRSLVSQGQLDLAGEILLADVADDLSFRDAGEPAALARRIVLGLTQEDRAEAALRLFRRAQPVCGFGIPAAEWFVRTLTGHGRHVEAIDAFLEFFQESPTVLRPSDDLYDLVLESVTQRGGYSAINVLETLQKLQTGPTDPSWAASTIQSCWRSTQDLEQTMQLYEQMQRFQSLQDAYEIHRRMVQIALMANEVNIAQLRLEHLHSHFPQAAADISLACCFARHHAAAGRWASVRAIFERAHCKIGPFSAQQQKEINVEFRAVLDEFSKNHTWGETEEFIEEFVRDAGVTLDSDLVNARLERYGKIRDSKSLCLWLEFCKSQGFQTDGAFWKSLFSRARTNWDYNDARLASLFHELRTEFDLHNDLPEAKQYLRKLRENGTSKTKVFRVRSPKKYHPWDEHTTYERMKADAQKGQWTSALGSYKRAVHNGMGFSSRCLRLAVQSCVQKRGSACSQARELVQHAQQAGHNVSNAMLPIVLMKLEEIALQVSEAPSADASDRPNIYLPIKELFGDLRADDVPIDDSIFHKAAQICLANRNYREAIAICVSAAECNGSQDLCYNAWNFSNLCRAFAARHDYEKLGWLLEQVRDREYRTWKYTRASLKSTAHYLKKASQSEKAEELKASDLEMLGRVQQTLNAITQQKAEQRAQLSETIEAVFDVSGEEREREQLENGRSREPVGKVKLGLDHYGDALEVAGYVKKDAEVQQDAQSDSDRILEMLRKPAGPENYTDALEPDRKPANAVKGGKFILRASSKGDEEEEEEKVTRGAPDGRHVELKGLDLRGLRDSL